MQNVEALIEHYKLLPHPEGGWYKETYRSKETIPANSLPSPFAGPRSMSTAIYFLLEQGNFSTFHKIQSDECWHFYAGQTLEIFVLQPSGDIEIIRLGNNVEAGECFQYVVPANLWFASRPIATADFCFVGCTVAPGFDFEDFELANAEDLIKQFPQHKILIQELCRS